MYWEDVPGDASTLIYLAKADAFAAAARCVSRILAPPSVWREAVVEGERIGAAEVPRIRAAAENGFLAHVELAPDDERAAGEIATVHRLGLGESEVLALARTGMRAIVDEGRAQRVAESLGIVTASTLFLPVLGVRRGAMSAEEAIRVLRQVAVVVGARAEAVFEIERHIEERYGN